MGESPFRRASVACRTSEKWRVMSGECSFGEGLRSATVSRPRRSADRGSPGDAPPVGDCGCRGRAGQETLPNQPSRYLVRAAQRRQIVAWRRELQVAPMATITAPHSSRAAAADRSLEAPAPGHRDGTIRSPASYPTRAMERPSSEVWCRPAGARKSGQFPAGWPQGIAPLGLPRIRTCHFRHTARHIMSSLRDGSLSESAIRLVPDAATVVVSCPWFWVSMHPPCFPPTVS